MRASFYATAGRGTVSGARLFWSLWEGKGGDDLSQETCLCIRTFHLRCIDGSCIAEGKRVFDKRAGGGFRKTPGGRSEAFLPKQTAEAPAGTGLYVMQFFTWTFEIQPKGCFFIHKTVKKITIKFRKGEFYEVQLLSGMYPEE